MGNRPNHPTRARLGIAACFAGVLALAGCQYFDKPGATPATFSNSAGMFKACPASKLYRQNVETVVQQKCAPCHGGAGSGHFALTTPADTDALIESNYAMVLSFLETTSSNRVPVTNNRILFKPTGGEGHQTILTASSSEYAAFSKWITLEAQYPCGSQMPDGAALIEDSPEH